MIGTVRTSLLFLSLVLFWWLGSGPSDTPAKADDISASAELCVREAVLLEASGPVESWIRRTYLSAHEDRLLAAISMVEKAVSAGEEAADLVPVAAVLRLEYERLSPNPQPPSDLVEVRVWVRAMSSFYHDEEIATLPGDAPEWVVELLALRLEAGDESGPPSARATAFGETARNRIESLDHVEIVDLLVVLAAVFFVLAAPSSATIRPHPPAPGDYLFLFSVVVWVRYLAVVALIMLPGVDGSFDLLDAVAQGAALALLVWLLHRRRHHWGEMIGPTRAGQWTVAALGAFAGWGVSWRLAALVPGLVSQDETVERLLSAIAPPNDLSSLPVMVLSTVLLAPVLEELVFRGLLHAGLREHIGPVLGTCLSALIFASAHQPTGLYEFVTLGAMGIAFAIAWERTGSIAPCIFAHMLVNASGIARMFL